MSVVNAIRQMVAAGFTIEQALTAAEIMEANTPVDAQAERRRAKDRERKRLRNSAESAEFVEQQALPSPDGPLPSPAPQPTPLNPPSCPDQASAAEQAPPRQAQPEAWQGKVDYEEVQRWVSGLVETNPVALNFDISPIVSLMRAGFSRERIEVGIRAAVAAAKHPIKSWKSFDGWVKNTAADTAPIAKPIDLETEWRNKLDHWRKRNDWPGVWGDPPGHACCKIPEAFVASYLDNWSREAAE